MAAALRLIGCALPALLLLACESNSRPRPAPGSPNGETISGSERIGWDQQAANTTELSTFRYAIYVDGVRSEIASVTCAPTETDGVFACSGRLPSMTPGVHILEIATYIHSTSIEGPRSAPLQVTVAGATAPGSPAVSTPLRHGDRITTSDRVTLTAERLVDGLEEPNDVAIATDGRIFVAEASGRVHLVDGARIVEALTVPEASRTGGILGLALAPDFPASQHVFALQAIGTDAGTPAFRLARYRVHGDLLVERMIVMRDVAASPDPSGAVRFGGDGKLYVAFDDANRPDVAADASEWNGKILRLNPDGRTPADQPAASPVFWSGLRSPASIAWSHDGALLWLTEEGPDGLERLRAIGTSGEQPRRTSQRATYVLPRPLGAGSMLTYRDPRIRQFAGDLFVAARDGGYLLRVIFDDTDDTQASRTERLLEGRAGSVRAVAAHGGALYFCTNDALWRLRSLVPSP